MYLHVMPPIVSEKLKLQILQSDKRILAFKHTYLKLHDQFVSLLDMKLQAQKQLYTTISFWDIKVLKISLTVVGHTEPHSPKLT